MEIITAILNVLMGIIGTLLPAVGVPDSFFIALDNAFVFLVDLLQQAAWLLPLNVFVVCITVMLVVDNFALLTKMVKWTVNLIRG